MTRRSLLSLFAAAPLVAAIDPEKLLWVPGRKLISIPKPRPVELCSKGLRPFATLPDPCILWVVGERLFAATRDATYEVKPSGELLPFHPERERFVLIPNVPVPWVKLEA
jgi:hypothetical protein